MASIFPVCGPTVEYMESSVFSGYITQNTYVDGADMRPCFLCHLQMFTYMTQVGWKASWTKRK